MFCCSNPSILEYRPFFNFGRQVNLGCKFDRINHELTPKNTDERIHFFKFEQQSSNCVCIDNIFSSFDPFLDLFGNSNGIHRNDAQTEPVVGPIDLVKLFIFDNNQAQQLSHFLFSTNDRYFVYKYEFISHGKKINTCSKNQVANIYYGRVGFIKITPTEPITERRADELLSYFRQNGKAKCPAALTGCKIETWINYREFYRHESFVQALDYVKNIDESEDIPLVFDALINVAKESKETSQNHDYLGKWKVIYGLELCIKRMYELMKLFERAKAKPGTVPPKTSKKAKDMLHQLDMSYPFTDVQYELPVQQSINYFYLLHDFREAFHAKIRRWCRKKSGKTIWFMDEYFHNTFIALSRDINRLKVQYFGPQFDHYIPRPTTCHQNNQENDQSFKQRTVTSLSNYDNIDGVGQRVPETRISDTKVFQNSRKDDAVFNSSQVDKAPNKPQHCINNNTDAVKESFQRHDDVQSSSRRRHHVFQYQPQTSISYTSETTTFPTNASQYGRLRDTYDSTKATKTHHQNTESVKTTKTTTPVKQAIDILTDYYPHYYRTNNGIQRHEATKIQYNVLIMGQSGVGKSTLLNAIKNYLVYPSAKQALDAEFEYMIATKFDVYDEDTYEPITVCIGNEDNEVFRGEHEAGSRTQSCKEHRMTYTPPGKESMTMNFIDTPGLTDTRGGDQDAINLKKIYNKLKSDVKDLHAICLVLKPNESVLTRSLETAILELLSIFPNEAMPNLVFFMTYAHGTFFRPGDTMTPLDAMRENLRESRGLDLPKLSKDTFYCVDNETFRYLCARHQNIPYTREGLEDYMYSWQESRTAVLRFMDWLRKKKVEPFKTRNLIRTANVKNLDPQQATRF